MALLTLSPKVLLLSIIFIFGNSYNLILAPVNAQAAQTTIGAVDCVTDPLKCITPTHSVSEATPYPYKHFCPQLSKDDEVWNRVLLLPEDTFGDRFTLLGIVYGMTILYFFLGISIASHIFMLSIEIIVSKTRKVRTVREEDGIMVQEERDVKIWNDTVANLTLMALGSSAPEILLSIIETAGNDFCPGALGPGTIVGSASYNLMIITAVCIVSVPTDTVKRIKEYKVFVTTSTFAMFAYLWLVFMIQVVSYDVVHPWEAIVTLVMFPILILVSYWAEYDFCIRGKKRKRSSIVSDIYDPDPREFPKNPVYQPLHRLYEDDWDNMMDESGNLNAEAVKGIYKALNEIAVLTDDEIAQIMATKLIQSKAHSPLWYKIRAIEALSARNRAHPALNEKLKEIMDVLNDMKRQETGRLGDLRPTVTSKDTYKNKAVIQFTSSCMVIPVVKGVFTVTVRRTGKEGVTVFCRVESYDGTAKKKKAYEPVAEKIVFDPYVEEHKFHIKIISDEVTNRDSNFFLKLYLTEENNDKMVALGPMTTMEIVLSDVQEPGEIQFTKKGQVTSTAEPFANIDVERVNGSIGPISVKWRATPHERCTAIAEVLEGTLTFENGEVKKNLEIPLNQGGRGAPQDEQFDVELVEIVHGAGLIGAQPLLTVAISSDPGFKLQVTRLIQMITEKVNIEETIVRQTYWEQIKSAYIVNGCKEEARRATIGDKILHWISLPWKATLCFLPTPYFLGGAPCFILTLAVIGLLTTVVGDMANILGWCMSLDPVTTGITIVAMGTSLPDTFASQIAAKQDKTADAAIGNITGSNCVNVFLGLGLPWTIASLYTTIKYEETLKVESESLAMIVTVYTMVSIMAQVILWLRRHTISFGAAELGGPSGTKYLTATFLVLGWLLYVMLSLMISQNTLGMGELAIKVASYIRIPNT